MIDAKYISLYLFGRCRLSDEYLSLHDQGNNLINYEVKQNEAHKEPDIIWYTVLGHSVNYLRSLEPWSFQFSVYRYIYISSIFHHESLKKLALEIMDVIYKLRFINTISTTGCFCRISRIIS